MVEFKFSVMQPMDRPVHRWDTCCRDWWRHAWDTQWACLRIGWVGGFFRFLPLALQPIIGTCRWHGLQTTPPWEPDEGRLP